MVGTAERAISRRKTIEITDMAGVAGLTGCLGGGQQSTDDTETDASGGGGGTPTEQEFKLKVVHWLPPDYSPIQNGLNPLIKETKQRLSDMPNSVKFNVFSGGQLGGGSDMLRMANNKSADVTDVVRAGRAM